MNFKKNLGVILELELIVIITGWLARIGLGAIIEYMTLALAIGNITVLLEDFNRKFATDRKLLTWQYFVGGGLVIMSVYAWLWASYSTEFVSLIIRLGIMFLCVMGGAMWMHFVYKPSTCTKEKIQSERWSKLKNKIKHATDKVAFDILACNLRFKPIGDTIEGELAFDIPLLKYGDEAVTLEEFSNVCESAPENVKLIEDTTEYLKNLLKTRG